MNREAIAIAEDLLGLNYQVLRETKIRGGIESEFWRVMGPQRHRVEDAQADRNALRDEIATKIQHWMDQCADADIMRDYRLTPRK